MINAVMFDTKDYDKEGFEKYRDGIDIRYFETKLTEDTVELCAGADAVIVFVNDTVSRNVLKRLKELNLRLVALRCAGYNQVDLSAAREYGIGIVRVPAYSPHAVAEHAIAMLLTSIRRIHKAYIRTRDFNFSLSGLVGTELFGKTAGIIGTGRIGRLLYGILSGFQMNMLAYDPFPLPETEIAYTSLEELLEKSDVISLHCPLTEDTYHLIDREAISKMKTGAVLINTSRGALIDTGALIEGLKSKKIGAACLDVYEEEGDLFFKDLSGHIMRDDNCVRLISMPNVLVTSHQGFLTEEALCSIAKTTLGNIRDYISGVGCMNEIR